MINIRKSFTVDDQNLDRLLQDLIRHVSELERRNDELQSTVDLATGGVVYLINDSSAHVRNDSGVYVRVE